MMIQGRRRLPRYHALLLAMVLACVGCESSRFHTEQTDGRSVRAAFDQQVLHPQAALTLPTVQGLNGPAAKASIDRYIRSFEVPAPASNVFTIGVGTGAGGSTAAPAVPATSR